MLRIGDFSKLSRISIRMLRHDDDMALLIPKMVDPMTGYRLYGEDQLTVAGRISDLKTMGFSLSMIAEILKSYRDPQKLAEYLELKRAEVSEELEQTTTRLHLLDTAVTRLRKDDCSMTYNVVIKTMPELYVASVRKTIPSYDKEGMLWGILMGETEPLHLRDANPSYTLAIFHDKDYKESDVDVEVQKSVIGTYTNTANVTFKTVPPVVVASCTYKGGYDKTGDVNQAVANWVSDNGYDFAGAAFFIYHVSPHETANPDEYVTEVCYPVCQK